MIRQHTEGQHKQWCLAKQVFLYKFFVNKYFTYTKQAKQGQRIQGWVMTLFMKSVWSLHENFFFM